MDADLMFDLCKIQASKKTTPTEKIFAKALETIMDDMKSMEVRLMLK